MSAALVLTPDDVARSGERPALRLVLADWRLGDLKLRVLPGLRAVEPVAPAAPSSKPAECRKPHGGSRKAPRPPAWPAHATAPASWPAAYSPPVDVGAFGIFEPKHRPAKPKQEHMRVRPPLRLYEPPEDLGEDATSAWSTGYLPLEANPYGEALGCAADLMVFAMDAVFDSRAGKRSDFTAQAKRLATAAHRAGCADIQRTAQDCENEGRRALTLAARLLGSLTDRRAYLAACVLDELDAFRAAPDDSRLAVLVHAVVQLADFVEGVASKGYVRRPGSPAPAFVQRSRSTGAALTNDELHDIRSAVRSKPHLRRAEWLSRRANPKTAGDSSFMQSVFLEYLERRARNDPAAAGDKNQRTDLARRCAETVRKYNREDALRYATSHDFSEESGSELPQVSLVIEGGE